MSSSTEIWNKICFLLNENIKQTCYENDYENQVVRAIECLGWDESKKEIKRQQTIPIGNQNSIKPDLIIYGQENRSLIPIEIKRPCENLGKSEIMGQIRSYMLQLKSDFGFLIGSELKVYYEGSSDLQPLLLEKIPFIKDSEKGVEFVNNFNKESFLKKEYMPYLETKLNNRNKEMEIENLLDLLTSEEMRQKVIDFLKKESGRFNDEIVSEVMEKLSVSISSKRYVASDKHDKNAVKTFSSGTPISLNDITKESFENPQSALLVCLYNVLSFLQQGSDWKTATEQTAKLLNLKSGRAVARKCGKEFGGGPKKDGGADAFQQWFSSGAMLDKLLEIKPKLSKNDYMIFKDLLS